MNDDVLICQNSLTVLSAKCSECHCCPHALTRKQVVFSKGDPLSTLAFVGEAPGADEDEQGIPFVGQAGRLLDKQIQAMRDYAAELSIAFPASPYVCKCTQMPATRKQAPEQWQRCRRMLLLAVAAATPIAQSPRYCRTR